MHFINKGNDMPPPDPLADPFVHYPNKERGMPVLRGDSGIKNLLVAKALLNSINHPADLEEYMGVSQQTLANHYSDLQYEVNICYTLILLLNCLIMISFFHFDFRLTLSRLPLYSSSKLSKTCSNAVINELPSCRKLTLSCSMPRNFLRMT